MTENPVPSGNPDVPPPAGTPPYPYSYPPGPDQAGAYQPGAYQPGAYPPGAYQPGAYQPGAYPPGAYPSGAYQGGYPPPPMPYGDYYQAAPTAPKNGLGIAALVVAIIALLGSFTIVGGILGGVIALILGVIGRSRAKSGEANNGGVALAGIILGVIAIIVSLVFIPIYVGLFNDIGGGGYFECLQQAGQDRTAVAQCSDELRQTMSNRLTDVPTR
ncbi:MAG: DUF4190 domain-containing protein [Mycobacteriaceae bacterium]|jgi:hypothetical protein